MKGKLKNKSKDVDIPTRKLDYSEEDDDDSEEEEEEEQLSLFGTRGVGKKVEAENEENVSIGRMLEYLLCDMRIKPI